LTDLLTDIPRQLHEYDLLDEVGRGPLCAVCRARWRVDGSEVALKVLDPRYAEDTDRVLRFEDEAMLAQSLRHPHIVAVHRVITQRESPLPFYVMDYLRGGNIGRYRAAWVGRLPELLRLMDGVCAALEYIHVRGLVHGDIKPTNVLLDGRGAAYLTDFGTTAAAADLAATGPTGGTVPYMAPEQFAAFAMGPAEGNPAGSVPPVDARADLYALGVLLYDLFVGELPFRGSNRFALLYQRLTTDPEPPPDVWAAVPSDIQSVVVKAMARAPTGRFQTAAEFATALRACSIGG
jgi:serine/threonine-protein kinase